jgi:outer membrane protein TolC
MLALSHALISTLGLGCLVGPRYEVPPAPVPHAAQYKEAGAWKVATPGDAIPRGAWWTMFRQPELDALQTQLNITNQSIVAAAESYIAARAQVRAAEAQ